MSRIQLPLALVLIVALAACGPAPAPTATQPPAPTSAPAQPAPTSAPTAAPTKPAGSCTLRLATTTSTADTGLLNFILPDFERRFACKVDVVAVGSSQAIAIGQKGDADVLMVHDRAKEDQFVADGHAKARYDLMYNDFVLVGPRRDPAKVAGLKVAKDAFKLIAGAKSNFASRGDGSGTNTAEMNIWKSAAITPTKEMSWYNALGQGMGDTLIFSNEKGAYTLADRGTWLATQAKLPNLALMVGGGSIKENADKTLYNPYGVLPVDPVKHPGVNSDMAANFVKWVTSVDEQKAIGAFGLDKFGQALFYADSQEWRNAQAPVGAPALTITGAVATPQALTLAALQAMQVKTSAEHPKTGKQDYEGVRLSGLLALAKPAATATKLVMTSGDGFAAEVTLVDVLKTPDCLLAFTSGKLNAVMPGMASNLWSKDVVKIEVK